MLDGATATSRTVEPVHQADGAALPNATDRPRRLADHDWLINESRCVATVERVDGSQVHGVLWQLDEHDLATLDSAEGVPVRYRRDRIDRAHRRRPARRMV